MWRRRGEKRGPRKKSVFFGACAKVRRWIKHVSHVPLSKTVHPISESPSSPVFSTLFKWTCSQPLIAFVFVQLRPLCVDILLGLQTRIYRDTLLYFTRLSSHRIVYIYFRCVAERK